MGKRNRQTRTTAGQAANEEGAARLRLGGRRLMRRRYGWNSVAQAEGDGRKWRGGGGERDGAAVEP